MSYKDEKKKKLKNSINSFNEDYSKSEIRKTNKNFHLTSGFGELSNKNKNKKQNTKNNTYLEQTKKNNKKTQQTANNNINPNYGKEYDYKSKKMLSDQSQKSKEYIRKSEVNKNNKKKDREEKEKKDREEKEKKEKEEKEKKEKKEREEKEKKEREEKEKKEREKLLIEKERERQKKLEKEKEEERKREEEIKKKKEEEEKIKNEKKEEDKDLTTTPLKSSIISSSSQTNNSDIFKIITCKIGLRNLGNTCFMNTCLQNLVHSDYFIKELFSKNHLISSKTPISQKFYELCKGLASCQKYAFSPDDFKSEFGCTHSIFGGYRQHDTQEFCRILLEDMNKELNIVKHPAKYEELKTSDKSKEECDRQFDDFFRKRENSLIMDVFYGQLINIFICECGKESYSFEKILDLPLLLKKNCNHSTKELLDDYFEEEEIKFETKCEKCGKKGKNHTKKVKFSQPPNILILSLQRIDGRSQRKIDSNVSFTDDLDLSKYIDKDCYKDSAKYTLYGIGNHYGSINFGHYYAYIKINDGKWYEFNDSKVSEYIINSRNSSEAYVLFYKKNYYSNK